jgi:hypothetical protein
MSRAKRISPIWLRYAWIMGFPESAAVRSPGPFE